MDEINVKSEPSQGASQPLIFGNINATNLLSSAVGGFGNNVLIPTNMMGLPSTVNNNQVIGILPVFIQGSQIPSNKDVHQNISQLQSTHEINVVNSDCQTSLKTNSQFTLPQNVEHLPCRDEQSQLTSSDTLILTSSSGIFSHNPVPLLISPCDAKPSLSSAQSQQNSSALQTAFSLVSDLSNRSVNLDNIPTVSLFTPMQREEGGARSDSMLISQIDDTNGTKTPLHVNQLQTSSNDKVSYRSPQTRSKSKKKAILASSRMQPETDNPCLHTDIIESTKEVIDQRGNNNKSSLRRDETIILPSNTEPQNSQTKSFLASSDTIVLPTENSRTVSLPRTVFSSTELPIETCSSGSFNISMSVMDNVPVPSPSLSTIPSLMLTDSVVEGTVNPSLLFDLISQPSQNPLPPAVKYLTLDKLFSNANSNSSVLATLQKSLQGSFLQPSSESISSTVAAKSTSTQTDWVLGNSLVCFKATKMSNEEGMEGNIPSSLLLEESLMNAAPTFVVEDQTIPSTVLTFVPQDQQPILSTDSAIQDSTSITNDRPNENCEEESDNSSGLFQCPVCRKGFHHKRDLKQHEKSHPKILKCDLCSSTFTRMGNYTRHRKIHNLKPGSRDVFSCAQCERQFLQRCDLKRHLLIHTKQEPYRCDKCGKGYIRHSDLVVHLRFHNKEKIFKCSLCEKSFFQSGDLNRHVRRAHKPDTQLTCGHCDRKYACEATLIRHMKVVHKDIIVNTVNQTVQ